MRKWIVLERREDGTMVVQSVQRNLQKKPGDLHPGRHLGTAEVEIVREMSRQGISQEKIGKQMGISRGAVGRIVRGDNASFAILQEEEIGSMGVFEAEAIKVETGLIGLRDAQQAVSGAYGAVPEEGAQPTGDQLRSVLLALHVEIDELAQELDWKPWKIKDVTSSAKAASELADVLAFLGLLIIYLERMGLTVTQMARTYESKSELNMQRAMMEVKDYKPRSAREATILRELGY
jgi:transcriptional regulator with XRE-family HTH domain